MIKRVPWTFIRKMMPLSWEEASWGYHRGYLGWLDIVGLASHRLELGEGDATVIELAGLSKSDAHQTEDLLSQLVLEPVDGDEKTIKAKWLYLSLAWLFKNRMAFPDPLEMIETIYADFDYPGEVAPFVRYMPTTDGYDPSIHTAEENQARIYRKWQDYLAWKLPAYSARVVQPA